MVAAHQALRIQRQCTVVRWCCKRIGAHFTIGADNVKGKDYIGNKYFEIPANPRVGKRKPVRWYDPPKGMDFQDPIPAEWEAWLRMRRCEPPTEEEVQKNLAIAQMKKENAAKLDAKRLEEGGSLPSIPEKGPQSYPKYEEYYSGDAENHPSKRKQ